jgi:hemerythrin-like domain-containing protein
VTPIQQSAHRRLDPCQSHILLDWAASVAQTIRRLPLNRLKELGSSLNETGRENMAARSGREAVPAAVMKRAHLEKLQLCEALERIADTLPKVDRLKCLSTANAIVPLLRNIHQYEETVIFPAYEAVLTGSDANLASTRRLRVEHVEDECFASEVTEILLAIGHGETVENAEAVGFMLRGFFESLRRHIAFEREHVLPMIGVVD